MLRKLIVLFFIWRIAVTLYALFVGSFIPLQMQFTGFHRYGVGMPSWLWMWGNFDGQHYMEIARRGYQALEYGFFPLFPIAIRVVNILTDSHLLSGIIISAFALIGALYTLNRLLKFDRYSSLIPLFFVSLLLFPTAYSLGAVYNDSLFLFLSSLCLLWGRQGKWGWASVAGALATLARLNGLVLVGFLIVEWVQQNFQTKPLLDPPLKGEARLEKNTSPMRGGAVGFLLIPLAFIGYLFYINQTTGSWNNLFVSMTPWGQSKMVFPGIVVWRYLKILFLNHYYSLVYGVALLEFASLIFYGVFIVYSFFKLRLSYSLFFLASITLPTLTGTLQGMPRYGLHLYPLFLGIALFLSTKPQWAKVVWFTISFILLGILVGFFTRGYFVA